MASEASEPNPFESPREIDAGEQATAGIAPPRRFRWRVIPVSLLYICGIVLGVMAIIELVVWLPLCLYLLHDPLDRGRAAFGILVLLNLHIWVAVGCVLTARSWWTGRWRRGFVFLVLAIVPAEIVAFLYQLYLGSPLPS